MVENPAAVPVVAVEAVVAPAVELADVPLPDVVDVAGGVAGAGVTFGVGSGTESGTYGNSVTLVGRTMP